MLPGSVIGIIGGGQLGRMFALEAANMGYRTHIFSPGENDPAKQVTNLATTADYSDLSAARSFAEACDVITFEFENIPAETVAAMAAITPTYPDYNVLRICQNRVLEKSFINAQNIQTAPWQEVKSLDELLLSLAELGLPAILKTAEQGYDGKGQRLIKTLDDATSAWSELSGVQLVLEGFVDFTAEISVITARRQSGEVASFPPAHNMHSGGILHTSSVPVSSELLSADLQARAIQISESLTSAYNLVGIHAVEMFVTRSGELVVNEIAPRPHNSGHWTMNGCVTSQFEQHLRAICNLPFGSTEITKPIQMLNLIGDDIHRIPEYLSNPNAKVHLYGKLEAKSGRKMGHINFIA